VKAAMHTKAVIASQMSVRPWKRGWLELNTQTGLRRWWSSLNTTVESVRISGGTIAVTCRVRNIWNESSKLLFFFHESNSGYRLVNGSSSSVWWEGFPSLKTSSSKSQIHLYANLDDTAVKASPTLQGLRHACCLAIGKPE